MRAGSKNRSERKLEGSEDADSDRGQEEAVSLPGMEQMIRLVAPLSEDRLYLIRV